MLRAELVWLNRTTPSQMELMIYGSSIAYKCSCSESPQPCLDAVVPREELAEALAAVVELAGPPDSDADVAWRAELIKWFTAVCSCRCSAG